MLVQVLFSNACTVCVILSVLLCTSCVVWVVIDVEYLSTLSSTTVEVMLILAPWGSGCRGNSRCNETSTSKKGQITSPVCVLSVG